MRIAGRRAVLRGAGATILAGMAPSFAPAVGGHRPTGYSRTDWGRDPWALGSYSFIAKGASRRDHATLAEPVAGRLYFAGEAAHPRFNSTVHAAHEAGLRAAEEAVDAGHSRIAVIGAGMAGLSAAWHLTQAGQSATVIEARGRIGGRIHTVPALGQSLDLGASWIHGEDGNPLVALAARAGARTVATADSYVIRGADGRSISSWWAPGWLDGITEIQNSFGADPDRMDFDAYGDNDADYEGADLLFPGGYADLLRALAAGYELRLTTPVRRISHGIQGVGVDGEEFDAAIVTLPLGVLKAGQVAFDPPLPAPKQAAVERLGMGLLDKLYLAFDEVFWDADATWITLADTGLPRGQFNGWLNLTPYLGAPILLGFNGGPAARALSELDDAALVAAAMGALNRAYPA